MGIYHHFGYGHHNITGVGEREVLGLLGGFGFVVLLPNVHGVEEGFGLGL